jgi:hypothetical protein
VEKIFLFLPTTVAYFQGKKKHENAQWQRGVFHKVGATAHMGAVKLSSKDC